MLIDDGPARRSASIMRSAACPIAAFGNSDGDLAMLETTTQQPDSKRASASAAFVWHTDGVREYAYDRNTHVGRLERRASIWRRARLACSST